MSFTLAGTLSSSFCYDLSQQWRTEILVVGFVCMVTAMWTFKYFFLCWNLKHFGFLKVFFSNWKAIACRLLYSITLAIPATRWFSSLKGSPPLVNNTVGFRASSHLSQHGHFWISPPGTPLLPSLLCCTSFIQLLVPPLQRTSEERQESVFPQHCCSSELLSMHRIPTMSNLLSVAHSPPKGHRKMSPLVSCLQKTGINF